MYVDDAVLLCSDNTCNGQKIKSEAEMLQIKSRVPAGVGLNLNPLTNSS